MSEISNRYRQSALVMEAVFGGFCLVMAVYNFFYSTPYYVFLSLLGLALDFLPAIIEKVLAIKTDYLLRMAANLYIFMTFGIGMIFNGYDRIPYYDKVMHTITGVAFGLCGVIAFYVLKPREKGKIQVKKTEFWQAAFFALGFSTIVSVSWEIIEFVLNLILHNDPQKVAETGVTDTMMDMIVCMIGTLVFWLPMKAYYNNGRTGLLMGIFESFRESNQHQIPERAETVRKRKKNKKK